MVKARKFYPDHQVRVGHEVKESLKRRIVKCGVDLSCIAMIGVKEKLVEVILMRVEPREIGIAMTFIAVDVATSQVVRTVEAVFPSVDDVQPIAATNFFAIVGITTPGFLEIPGAPTEGWVDDSPVDLSVGKVELPPGVHRVKLGDHEVKTMILPGQIRKMTLEELGINPSPNPSASEPAIAKVEPVNTPSEPPMGKVEPTPPTPAEPVSSTPAAGVEASGPGLLPPRLVSYVGYGVAGFGAVLLGVGGYYGSKTAVKLKSSTSQAQAAKMNHDARAAARRANALLGVGAGLVAAGGALWVIDTFLLKEPSVARVGTAVTDGGATVLVQLQF